MDKIPKAKAEMIPTITSIEKNSAEFFTNIFNNFKKQAPATGKIESNIENLKLFRRSYPKYLHIDKQIPKRLTPGKNDRSCAIPTFNPSFNENTFLLVGFLSQRYNTMPKPIKFIADNFAEEKLTSINSKIPNIIIVGRLASKIIKKKSRSLDFLLSIKSKPPKKILKQSR